LHSADFKAFARSRRFSSEYLKAAVVYADERRCAVAVGKKVSRLAVHRNKVKRRLKYLIMKSYKSLPQNAWVLFIALPAVAALSFDELEKDYNILIHRICTAKSGHRPYKAV
jgi:ribonuclease P protein component